VVIFIVRAAVLAAPVRVDRDLESDVRAFVPGDDRARGVAQQLGPGSRLVSVSPSVVDNCQSLEPIGWVVSRATSADGRGGHRPPDGFVNNTKLLIWELKRTLSVFVRQGARPAKALAPTGCGVEISGSRVLSLTQPEASELWKRPAKGYSPSVLSLRSGSSARP
jgi:hypothetical protein